MILLPIDSQGYVYHGQCTGGRSRIGEATFMGLAFLESSFHVRGTFNVVY